MHVSLVSLAVGSRGRSGRFPWPVRQSSTPGQGCAEVFCFCTEAAEFRTRGVEFVEPCAQLRVRGAEGLPTALLIIANSKLQLLANVLGLLARLLQGCLELLHVARLHVQLPPEGFIMPFLFRGEGLHRRLQRRHLRLPPCGAGACLVQVAHGGGQGSLASAVLLLQLGGIHLGCTHRGGAHLLSPLPRSRPMALASHLPHHVFGEEAARLRRGVGELDRELHPSRRELWLGTARRFG